ncbi:MAG: PEP-CTERM sorting domain-containing protein [Pirellulales bacterium]
MLRGIVFSASLSFLIVCPLNRARAAIVAMQSSDFTLPQTEQFDELRIFYQSQLSVNLIVSTASISPSDLAGASLFVGWLPATNYLASEISALSGFLSGGGHILFVGENGSFSGANNAISAGTAALGGSMSIVNSIVDAGFHLATTANGQILPHLLTTGVNRFEYAAPSGLSGVIGGQGFFLDTSLANTFGASQLVGGGRLTILSDTNVVDFADLTLDNDTFFLNVAIIPEPSTVILAAMGLVGLAAFGSRRRKR